MTTNAFEKVALRDAFGTFATGVTVVTAFDAQGTPVGFTANSFTSVSLDPPLLLICLKTSSSNLQSFSEADRFSINILAGDQAAISQRFAASSVDRFAEVIWHSKGGSAPLIEGVAAWFDCTHHSVIGAGDHIILIGQVVAFDRSMHAPLIYLKGQYLGAPPATNLSRRRVEGSIRAGCILAYGNHILMQACPRGWTLPMSAPCAAFREARLDLEKTLLTLGAQPQSNVIYSVFDDPESSGTWVFFHGQLSNPPPAGEDLKLFSIDSVPLLDVPTRPMRSMLRRYVSEAQSDSFGIYVDAPQQVGDVVRFADGVATPWEAAFRSEGLAQ